MCNISVVWMVLTRADEWKEWLRKWKSPVAIIINSFLKSTIYNWTAELIEQSGLNIVDMGVILYKQYMITNGKLLINKSFWTAVLRGVVLYFARCLCLGMMAGKGWQMTNLARTASHVDWGPPVLYISPPLHQPLGQSSVLCIGLLSSPAWEMTSHWLSSPAGPPACCCLHTTLFSP